MKGNPAAGRSLLVALLALVVGACAHLPQPAELPAAGSVLEALRLDPEVEQRVLALDPEHISDADVRGTLAKVPAPYLVLLHGGIYPVYLAMTSFAHFLKGMGYPDRAIRRPDDVHDNVYSYSPYQDSRELAGLIAWHYEREGVRPMMIGHSQGGVQAVKVLYDFAGWHGDLQVWNPVTDAFEDRTTIVDPLTGATRSVVGLILPYSSSVAAGGVMLLLPNQWSMMARLSHIPDTVEDFTGFTVGVDFIALAFPGMRGDYEADGTAKVRNIVLPYWYYHPLVPMTSQLAETEAMRDWINAYSPGRPDLEQTLPAGPVYNALWAADVWYSIKKHWCLEAQRLIRARRAALAKP